MSEKNSRNNKFKDKKDYDLSQNKQIEKYKIANEQIMKVPGDGNCMHVSSLAALLALWLVDYDTFSREFKRIFINFPESKIKALYQKLSDCKNIANLDDVKDLAKYLRYPICEWIYNNLKKVTNGLITTENEILDEVDKQIQKNPLLAKILNTNEEKISFFLDLILEDSNYGSSIELNALCNIFQKNINVQYKNLEQNFIPQDSQNFNDDQVIKLKFDNEHYDFISQVPAREINYLNDLQVVYNDKVHNKKQENSIPGDYQEEKKLFLADIENSDEKFAWELQLQELENNRISLSQQFNLEESEFDMHCP